MYDMILLDTVALIQYPIYLLIIIGAGSSLTVQFLLLLEQIKLPTDQRPDYTKFIYYWPFILNPLISAFLVFVYAISRDFSLSPVLAFHIGASAPLIIKGMVSTAPTGLTKKLKNPSIKK